MATRTSSSTKRTTARRFRPTPAWRRMTADDAADAGALALAMNNATNNASLVLAFELSKGGKVLLFVGDAQAATGDPGRKTSSTTVATRSRRRICCGRTVLYKVGHHGSHNATMKGKVGSHEASLAIMAQGKHAAEFVAMITAVEAWAHQKPKPDWNHPLPAIKTGARGKGRRARFADGLELARQAGRRWSGQLAGLFGPRDRNASLFRSDDRCLTAIARCAVA